MRRFVLSLSAVLGAATLAACAAGGSVLSFSSDRTPDHVIITVAAPSNLARVLPGASLPLSAVAVRGSDNGVLAPNRFRWSAALTTGQQYPINSLGQTKPCASVMITQGGVTTPYTADFGIDIVIDPVNEANILFSPPTILSPPPGATLTTSYPYCVTITAQAGSFDQTLQKFVPDGAPGTITVAVMDPQNPLP
ncbi:MAG TPA: hypothetical protein VGX02_03655 [Candidatus Eremiobacteraceae bacterium]|jgi:hypothetical protein|nr:hypothetical protein [Candidatus Eremiobacteraceae bacterium]